MERGVPNTFNGHPVPYYHNNYNHQQHHHPHQFHPHHIGGAGYHHYGPNDNGDQRFHQQHYDHFPGQQHVTGDPNGPFCAGGFAPNGGVRKRTLQPTAEVSPDATDGGSFAKLYVAPVPRTASEKDIHLVFGHHGNVVDIIIPRDKRTGDRAAYCFVKYKSVAEGDRAIAALQDQYTFPGEIAPVKVRYADGERERIGQIPDKLYVGCLSKQTTKKEVQEVFTTYGYIEDIYMVRDEQKQSRGCAFVQYSRREMALAAIKGLNGLFTMRGCDQPLVVKFADPKKPRLGEARSTANVAPAMQRFDSNWHPPAVPQWGNKESAAPKQHDLSSQFHHFPRQSAQAVFEGHKQMHQETPPQKFEQQQKTQFASVEARGNTEEIAGNSSAVPQDPKTTPEYDWSEHTCPDGYKYYYNCITCESTWEKPEEYSLFEKQLHAQEELEEQKELQERGEPQAQTEPQEQTKLQEQQELQEQTKLQGQQELQEQKEPQEQTKLQGQQELQEQKEPQDLEPQSPPLNCCSEEAVANREVKTDSHLLQQDIGDQQPSLSTSDPDNNLIQSVESVPVGATCS